MTLCDRFPSLNPLSLEDYPAEKVFMMIGRLLNYDKKNLKDKHKNVHSKDNKTNTTVLKVLPSKRIG